MVLLGQSAWSQTIFYRARIVVDEGVPPPVTPQIHSNSCAIATIFGNGEVEYSMSAFSGSDTCAVTIRLAGYRRADTVLRSGAVIALKRLGSYSNPTVSLATLGAPADARKAFQKGIAAMCEKKWADAQSAFERAVAVYPDYAPAWSALGETLVAQQKPQQAQAAFEGALRSDPRFAAAWAHLARLAADGKRMEEALRAAERALQLDATGFPGVYVVQAMANLSLQRLDAAERSARRAIELDIYRELPRAERVLGSVLAAKDDREGAIEHWQKYLAMSPKAEDAAEVRRAIADAGERAAR